MGNRKIYPNDEDTIRMPFNIKTEENLIQYINQYAFEEGYIDADERREYGITAKGLEQLRTLEGIKHNQKTFWVSITV